MEIAKLDGTILNNNKKLLKKATLGIASLAMGSMLYCTPAVAQEPKTDTVNIENVPTETKDSDLLKKLLVVLGSTATLFGLLEFMSYAITKFPDKNKTKDRDDFENKPLNHLM